MIRNARVKAGLTTCRLSDELASCGVKALVTLVKQGKKESIKSSFDLVYAAAVVLGLRLEKALRAAFLQRVRWCVDREREALQSMAEGRGLKPEAVERMPSLRGLK